jgi:hypothetical protein
MMLAHDRLCLSGQKNTCVPESQVKASKRFREPLDEGEDENKEPCAKQTRQHTELTPPANKDTFSYMGVSFLG